MLRLGGRRAAALRFQALASLGLVAPASATYASKSSYEAAQQTEGGAWRWAALAGVGLAAAGTGYSLTQQPSLADAKPQSYTRDEVAKHKTKEQRIWVTYKVRSAPARPTFPEPSRRQHVETHAQVLARRALC